MIFCVYTYDFILFQLQIMFIFHRTYVSGTFWFHDANWVRKSLWKHFLQSFFLFVCFSSTRCNILKFCLFLDVLKNCAVTNELKTKWWKKMVYMFLLWNVKTFSNQYCCRGTKTDRHIHRREEQERWPRSPWRLFCLDQHCWILNTQTNVGQFMMLVILKNQF